MTKLITRPALSDAGGIPFLDDTFAARRLLALNVAVRRTEAQRRVIAGIARHDDAEAWLTPTLAFALSISSTPLPALPLTQARRQAIGKALAAVSERMPSWASLLRLPIRYARLHPPRGAISASSRDWPQHVLLADDAFATGQELAEQIVHELAHQWLYLIEDIWPLQEPSARTISLPSGTRARSPAEVVGAAHVAAVLIRMYRAEDTTWAAARAATLTSYGLACLELADATSMHLTDTGHLISQRLKEAF